MRTKATGLVAATMRTLAKAKAAEEASGYHGRSRATRARRRGGRLGGQQSLDEGIGRSLQNERMRRYEHVLVSVQEAGLRLVGHVA
jgi:hypothetical protein